MCLDYATLPGNEKFLVGVKRRAQGIMGGRGGAVRFSAVALNEILFSGGAQLGNIRTRRLLRVCAQTFRHTRAYI